MAARIIIQTLAGENFAFNLKRSQPTWNDWNILINNEGTYEAFAIEGAKNQVMSIQKDAIQYLKKSSIVLW